MCACRELLVAFRFLSSALGFVAELHPGSVHSNCLDRPIFARVKTCSNAKILQCWSDAWEAKFLKFGVCVGVFFSLFGNFTRKESLESPWFFAAHKQHFGEGVADDSTRLGPDGTWYHTSIPTQERGQMIAAGQAPGGIWPVAIILPPCAQTHRDTHKCDWTKHAVVENRRLEKVGGSV